MIATFRNLGVLALLAMGGACERWGPVLPEGTIWDHPLGGHLAAGPDGDLFVLAEPSSPGLSGRPKTAGCSGRGCGAAAATAMPPTSMWVGTATSA